MHIKPTHPVVAEIASRLAGEGTGNVLALAVAGGGMRGVVPGGMLAGLEVAGVPPTTFDLVVGVSAGAVGASYYLAGQAAAGVRVFWEHLASGRFIQLRRVASGRPVMDLDFLFTQVLQRDVPLDAATVVAARTLAVLTASPTRRATLPLGPPESVGDLYAMLRASCHVPLFAGRPPVVGGEPLFDGSLTEPIPWRTAVALGATHVLVLSSTHPASARSRQSPVEALVSRCYDFRYPGVHDVIASQVRSSRRTRAHLAERTAAPHAPPFMLELFVPKGCDVSPLCRDPAGLRAAASAGRQSAAALAGALHS